MDQIQASRSVLKQSQERDFPYIIKMCGLDIIVLENVFSPLDFSDSEIFTKAFPDVKGQKVWEIGCGTGITSVYLAKNGASSVLATDINPDAVRNTKINAIMNDVKIDSLVADIYNVNNSINESTINDFDKIYWNMPFLWLPNNTELESMFDRSLFDPGYRQTERFLMGGTYKIKPDGSLIIGTGELIKGKGNFGSQKILKGLADKYGYKMELITEEESTEINPVKFLLYELKKK